ncbi:hypothetical protein [Ralstonia phage RP13]|nr:hypothetical protein [Ralstonia phage RP13]
MSQDSSKKIDYVVAGALYDFAARLTTLDQSITVGAKHNASPMAELVNKFINERGVDQSEAMVQDWTECLTAGPDQSKTAMAFQMIKQAINNDYGYAWSWHCNIAMSMKDTFSGFPIDKELLHRLCNEAAARFMKLCFDVDTSKEPGQ